MVSQCDRIHLTIQSPLPRSHLPLLFIGMEQIMLSNFRLADEALHAAAALCENDPLLCNERGVMAFNHGEYVFCNPSFPWFRRVSDEPTLPLLCGTVMKKRQISSRKRLTVRRLRRVRSRRGLSRI